MSVLWATIPEMLDAQAERRASAEAVVAADVRLDFRTLRERALDLAAALAARGIQPGDRIAVWAPNGWRWTIVAAGCWYAGATLVPISTRFGAFEVGDILTRAEAAALFVENGFLGQDYVALLRQDFGEPADGRPFAGLPGAHILVGLDGVPTGGVGFDTLLAEGAAQPRPPDRHEATAPATTPVTTARKATDLAEILFTSGTTGQPKAVLLDHRTLLASYRDYGHIAGFRPGDRYLVVMPFGHGGGLNGCLLTCLIHGMANVPLAAFTPAEALEIIEREQITVLLGPPQLYGQLLNAPELASHDVSSLRVALTGAASVPPSLIEELRALGIERVVNAYGAIETSVISMTRADDPVEVIVGSAGRAMPGMEIQIADDAGHPLPAGETGEIYVRGSGLMLGYLDPDQTAAAIDGDGWFHTGDIGVMDRSGNVRIVDRRHDLFHVGGFNVYPAEVESFLLRHPAIDAVAVVGQPDGKLGSVGVAFVVPSPDTGLDPDQVVGWAREKMAGYKVPRRVELVAALPLNPTGKVDKIRLRALAAEAADAGQAGR